MSFLYQANSAEGLEGRVIIAQKRYQHQVLQYNRQECINKVEARRSLKEQINKRYSQINHDAIESLQIAEKSKLKEKLYRQSLLKEAYDSQLKDKQQKCKKQRQYERKYASLYNQYIEYDSQRRINDLLSLYQHPTYVISNIRAKTETSPQQNPEGKFINSPIEPNRDRHSLLFPPINKSFDLQNTFKGRHYSQEKQRKV